MTRMQSPTVPLNLHACLSARYPQLSPRKAGQRRRGVRTFVSRHSPAANRRYERHFAPVSRGRFLFKEHAMVGIGWCVAAWKLAQSRTFESELDAPLSGDVARGTWHEPSLEYHNICKTAEAYAGYRYVWL